MVFPPKIPGKRRVRKIKQEDTAPRLANRATGKWGKHLLKRVKEEAMKGMMMRRITILFIL
jgi:hypothetical protein